MFIQGLSARQDNAKQKQKQKHGAGRRQVVVVVGVMSLPSCVTSLVRVTGDSGDPALEQD